MNLFEQVNLGDNDQLRTQSADQFSLNKILELDTQDMIFKLKRLKSTDEGDKKYHEIKLSHLNGKIIIQIIDISSKFIKEFDE